ncbi:MAG: GntR family transcriptional regulator [Mogibacterium sp.]|nr:GntR family transcriptional regulator [Mogibacterium sp.]
MASNVSTEDNNQPLSSTLFTEIQKDILSGKLQSGTKLTEQSICKQYNVSRTPVREAFRQLESDGLIENIPNRGAFVIGLSKRDISDLFDLRCIFEMKAVEWAIMRMDDEEIDKLRENIEFMEFYTLKGDVDKVMTFNSHFHNIIYKGTKNRMLYQTLSAYQIYLKHSAPSRTFSDDYLNTILTEHKAIFDAFETRNPAAGRKAMQYHMEQSKLRRMSKYF